MTELITAVKDTEKPNMELIINEMFRCKSKQNIELCFYNTFLCFSGEIRPFTVICTRSNPKALLSYQCGEKQTKINVNRFQINRFSLTEEIQNLTTRYFQIKTAL